MSSPAEHCSLLVTDSAAQSCAVSEFDIARYKQGKLQADSDQLAEEMPVALVYNGEPHVVMLATPQDLRDFAIGFSITEGIVEDAGEIESIRAMPQSGGIEVQIAIPFPRAIVVHQRKRNLAGRSGCGLCGTALLEDAIRQPPAVGPGPQININVLHHALKELRQHQPLNAATGSIHAAAWVSIDGDIELLREDVGRHNALDKLIGALMQQPEFDPAQGFIIVTSRASYEMIVKTAMAGVACMAAISAPTALAVRLGVNSNMTLIGFARDRGHVVYSDPQKLLESESI